MADDVDKNEITIEDFTTETVDGTGVFDVMTRSILAHLKAEFKAGRITGPEYATVYLGALQGTQDRALEFLLKKDEQSFKLQLLEIELDKALLEKDKIEAEILLIQAQVRKIDSDILVNQSVISVNNSQITKLGKESINVEADTALVAAKTVNVPLEGNVLTANECKLKAEYDVLLKQKGKVDAETSVLNQKKVTEKAQTSGTGVDTTSILGRQMGLYKAQADGFVRDAEQKAAKIMADTWNVRRTTDEATEPNVDNKLDDLSVGKAISQLLTGIGKP